MFPDLLSSALAIIGAWAALRLIGNERERRQGEIAAAHPPAPPPPGEPVAATPAATSTTAVKRPSGAPAGMSRQQAAR